MLYFIKMDEHVNYILTKASDKLKTKYPIYRIHRYNYVSNVEVSTDSIAELDIADGDTHIRFEYSEELNPWSTATSGLHMYVERTYRTTNNITMSNTFPGTSNIKLNVDDMLTIADNIDLFEIFNELATYLEISDTPQDNALYLVTYSKAMFERIKFLIELAKIPPYENIRPAIQF